MSSIQQTDWNQRLKDNGMKTIDETKTYRQTVKWLPYEQYMEKIYHHCAGRNFDEFNMQQDWFDGQLEPDKLLREAAYKYGLKYRNSCEKDEDWTKEDQKVLEEKLYTMFKEVVNCYK